jgi:hypothetical protein
MATLGEGTRALGRAIACGEVQGRYEAAHLSAAIIPDAPGGGPSRDHSMSINILTETYISSRIILA